MKDQNKPKMLNRVIMLLVAAASVFIGSGVFTFCYARGYSYMSDKPEVCINCHVMNEKYVAWQVSSHRDIGCNDCHLPHKTIFHKLYTKGLNGFNHSYAFTFLDVQTIRIRRWNEKVVEANCVRCHEATVANIFMGDIGDNRCLTCHRGTGHAF